MGSSDKNSSPCFQFTLLISIEFSIHRGSISTYQIKCKEKCVRNNVVYGNSAWLWVLYCCPSHVANAGSLQSWCRSCGDSITSCSCKMEKNFVSIFSHLACGVYMLLKAIPPTLVRIGFLVWLQSWCFKNKDLCWRVKMVITFRVVCWHLLYTLMMTGKIPLRCGDWKWLSVVCCLGFACTEMMKVSKWKLWRIFQTHTGRNQSSISASCTHSISFMSGAWWSMTEWWCSMLTTCFCVIQMNFSNVASFVLLSSIPAFSTLAFLYCRQAIPSNRLFLWNDTSKQKPCWVSYSTNNLSEWFLSMTKPTTW